MTTSTYNLRRIIIRRAKNAASFIEGISFDTYRADPLKRSACEMSLIASGWALEKLKERGEIGDDTADRVITLGAELQGDTSGDTEAEQSWKAVTVDLPRVAAALWREV